MRIFTYKPLAFISRSSVIPNVFVTKIVFEKKFITKGVMISEDIRAVMRN